MKLAARQERASAVVHEASRLLGMSGSEVDHPDPIHSLDPKQIQVDGRERHAEQTGRYHGDTAEETASRRQTRISVGNNHHGNGGTRSPFNT